MAELSGFTIAVIGLVLAILAAAVVGIWRWRVAALVRRTQQLEERVTQRTAALQLATEELHFLAFHDDLTALINQRGFWQHADKLEMESRRGDSMFGLVLVDLDHFKKINDEYGHRTGDEVLRHAGGLMQRICSEEDFVCRYGGEEFAILKVDTSPDELRQLAEQLRGEMEARPYEGKDSRIEFTVSVGVSFWLGGKDNVEAMFGRADKAMYEAKETRNAWMMWNPAMEFESAPQNS
ncbi:MAG: diguanylate cyclase [Gammaproteobacteria bacterium]|nr:diguanylate cyclase [Gammaproteobacteria bacterium]NNF60670.1 diguanylate cyclase [Gammaproteobacteria bacterium]